MIMSLKQKKIKIKPGIKLNHNIYVRDRLGACSLFGTNFCWFAPGAVFLFFGTKYYCVCGLRPFGSGSRFSSYTARDHLALKEKQGVDVVTAALLFATLFRSRKLYMT